MQKPRLTKLQRNKKSKTKQNKNLPKENVICKEIQIYIHVEGTTKTNKQQQNHGQIPTCSLQRGQ